MIPFTVYQMKGWLFTHKKHMIATDISPIFERLLRSITALHVELMSTYIAQMSMKIRKKELR